MKGLGLRSNRITFSILIVASEKKDGMEEAQMLPSQAKKDGASPTLIMCRCIIEPSAKVIALSPTTLMASNTSVLKETKTFNCPEEDTTYLGSLNREHVMKL